MIGLGASAFLLAYSMPESLRAVSYGTLAGMAVVVGGAYVVLRANVRPLSGTREWLHARGLAPALGLEPDRPPAPLRGRHRRRSPRGTAASLAPLALYEAAFHLAGVAEVYVTLGLIAPAG